MALNTLTRDITLELEAPHHARQVNDMVDRVFGPGRYVKTAERLREESAPVTELSFVALKGDTVIGSVRLWPVFVWDEAENTHEPLVFLGPICVEPTYRGHGVGKALVHAAVEAAFVKGLRAVLLVGSRSYFEPFGFSVAEDIALPGPVDANRVLIRYRDDSVSLSGLVVKVVNP